MVASFDPSALPYKTASLVHFVGGVLLHETAHAFVDPHIECYEMEWPASCDATPEGAYGVEAWRSHVRLKATADTLDSQVCYEMEWLDRQASCLSIYDKDGFPPCSTEWVCPVPEESGGDTG